MGSTLAFELIQQAPPLFARSRSLGQKLASRKRDFSGVAENSSDRKRAKRGDGASNLLEQFKRNFCVGIFLSRHP